MQTDMENKLFSFLFAYSPILVVTSVKTETNLYFVAKGLFETQCLALNLKSLTSKDVCYSCVDEKLLDKNEILCLAVNDAQEFSFSKPVRNFLKVFLLDDKSKLRLLTSVKERILFEIHSWKTSVLTFLVGISYEYLSCLLKFLFEQESEGNYRTHKHSIREYIFRNSTFKNILAINLAQLDEVTIENHKNKSIVFNQPNEVCSKTVDNLFLENIIKLLARTLQMKINLENKLQVTLLSNMLKLFETKGELICSFEASEKSQHSLELGNTFKACGQAESQTKVFKNFEGVLTNNHFSKHWEPLNYSEDFLQKVDEVLGRHMNVNCKIGSSKCFYDEQNSTQNFNVNYKVLLEQKSFDKVSQENSHNHKKRRFQKRNLRKPKDSSSNTSFFKDHEFEWDSCYESDISTSPKSDITDCNLKEIFNKVDIAETAIPQTPKTQEYNLQSETSFKNVLNNSEELRVNSKKDNLRYLDFNNNESISKRVIPTFKQRDAPLLPLTRPANCSACIHSPYDTCDTNACSQFQLGVRITKPKKIDQEKVKCAMCGNVILKKCSLTNRFGLLLNCRHCFCYQCVRRGNNGQQHFSFIASLGVDCPQCGIHSPAVIPSSRWIDSQTEKKSLFKNYFIEVFEVLNKREAMTFTEEACLNAFRKKLMNPLANNFSTFEKYPSVF